MNFIKLNWCNCAYTLNSDILLLSYVDDIVIFTKTQMKETITLLKSKFDLRVLGKTTKLLGIEFKEIDNKMYIHQHSYVNKVCNSAISAHS